MGRLGNLVLLVRLLHRVAVQRQRADVGDRVPAGRVQPRRDPQRAELRDAGAVPAGRRGRRRRHVHLHAAVRHGHRRRHRRHDLPERHEIEARMGGAAGRDSRPRRGLHPDAARHAPGPRAGRHLRRVQVRVPDPVLHLAGYLVSHPHLVPSVRQTRRYE